VGVLGSGRAGRLVVRLGSHSPADAIRWRRRAARHASMTRRSGLTCWTRPRMASGPRAPAHSIGRNNERHFRSSTESRHDGRRGRVVAECESYGHHLWKTSATSGTAWSISGT
jgi:hypothetical protein